MRLPYVGMLLRAVVCSQCDAEGRVYPNHGTKSARRCSDFLRQSPELLRLLLSDRPHRAAQYSSVQHSTVRVSIATVVTPLL